MNLLKLMGLVGLACIGAIVSQTGDADAISCTTGDFPVNQGFGGNKCCNPPGQVTQACGSLQANISAPDCTVSGIGRRISAGLMSTASTEARTSCLNGAAGPVTRFSDFTREFPTPINQARCDVGNNCAGATAYRVQSF